MRPDRDAELAPRDVQIRMVVLLLGERADLVREGERAGEVAEAILLLEVMLVDGAPAAAELREQRRERRAAQGLRCRRGTERSAAPPALRFPVSSSRLLARAPAVRGFAGFRRRAAPTMLGRREARGQSPSDPPNPRRRLPRGQGLPRARDPYTLLVAVLLSAQCTDVKVNQITPLLFARAATPEAMRKLSVAEIRSIIRPCGLSPAKAKAIAGLSRILVEKHAGSVPADFEALEALPGVGHKTASVVMQQAFGHPAFPVDTHIHRLAARWGLSSGRSVEQTERDLKKLFPPLAWGRLHLQLIQFGREHCPAQRHDLRGTAASAPGPPRRPTSPANRSAAAREEAPQASARRARPRSGRAARRRRAK